MALLTKASQTPSRWVFNNTTLLYGSATVF